MKAKGRKGWLVTWEGSEFDAEKNCKIVTVLPSQFGEQSVSQMLPFLYCATDRNTLCDRINFYSSRKTPFFKKEFVINIELYYGHIFKRYLRARLVKNLRCEENKKDWADTKLFWTELPKHRQNPKWNPDEGLPENRNDMTIEVRGERDEVYSYSIRSHIKEEKMRKQSRAT